MTLKFAGLDEQQAREIVRHECGHVLVGRALGFSPGGIVLNEKGGGADSDHFLSFSEMKDVVEYIEKRLKVLYAGAIAQSLDNKGKCQPAKCLRFLTTTASDDMSKIRELSRLLVGMTDPGISQADYLKKLASNDELFSHQALKIVEANFILIGEIVDAFLLALKENVKAAKTISKTSLTSYKFTSEKIDTVIQNRAIILP